MCRSTRRISIASSKKRRTAFESERKALKLAQKQVEAVIKAKYSSAVEVSLSRGEVPESLVGCGREEEKEKKES